MALTHASAQMSAHHKRPKLFRVGARSPPPYTPRTELPTFLTQSQTPPFPFPTLHPTKYLFSNPFLHPPSPSFSLSLPPFLQGILGLQLALTAAVTAAFVFSAPLRNYVFTTTWPFWTSFGIAMALVIALGCSEDLRRRHPYNMIALGVFTTCEAVLVGTFSAMYDTRVVLLAVGITACEWGWVVEGCGLR